MATFKTLVDRAMEECGYDFTQSSSTPRTRLARRVNDWYRRILSRPGFKDLLRQAYSYTFDSVDAQAVYGFPMMAGRIDAIRQTTNMWRLEMRTMDWLRNEDPALTANGTPTVWIPRGWYQTNLQPSDASALVVKSSAGGDTTQTVRVEYLTATGARLIASVALNGTTDATLVASGVVEITKFYLSAVAVGTVTLYEDTSAGTVLATIPIGQTSIRSLQFQLWPTPTAVITYLVDATREISDLAQDTDEPVLPPDWHHILWRGAVRDEWMMKDDVERASVYNSDLEQELRHLNNWDWNLVDYLPASDMQDERISRLGGWYPRGS